MIYPTLGRSGLKVSAVGLGCNNFGWRINADDTKRVVHRALDLGVTLFDTADFYGKGQSEEFLGSALGARRKDVVVATKFGLPMGESEYSGGGSRRYIRTAVEASLKRLNTEYIDLYQLHFPDPKTPMVETLSALTDLVREGKVRYIGSSNLTGWQLVEADWLAKTERLEPFISAQNQYNLLDRNIERELIPAAEAYGVGVLPYFPLASGLLTGKYKRGSAPSEGTRLAANADGAKRLLTEKNFELTEKLAGFAAERGKSLLDLAFAWLLAQPRVPSVIAGATKPEQVEANVKAGEWKLSPEDAKAAGLITFRFG
jgi:aryl-alcohol dehydrogenase-like predicted oxidoreductase